VHLLTHFFADLLDRGAERGRVEPERAEIWDGTASSAVAAFEFVKVRLIGTKPNLGEKWKVALDLSRRIKAPANFMSS
jgi:hypothetical protein